MISKFNKGFRSFLSIFDNNCKYAWVTPLKDKKGITIADYNTTINEIEKKITEHDHSNKYITTRLAQANLAGKNGTDNFVNKIYFNNKLKKLNKKVNSNNASHTEFNTKLDDLERNVKIISTKGLTADLINKYSILNGPKYFFLQMDYKTIQCLLSTRHIDSIGNNTVNIELLGSTGMSEKELKIHTFQTLILLQR